MVRNTCMDFLTLNKTVIHSYNKRIQICNNAKPVDLIISPRLRAGSEPWLSISINYPEHSILVEARKNSVILTDKMAFNFVSEEYYDL